ncbi:hypothetical protein DRJ22_04245 [Candidatus Woesearchaeota archaeon]|nr:MAG: hypothetical protein DRJ22_04245 [Candidatus Woesearchaeota archaeon]
MVLIQVNSPNWFFGVDCFLELGASLITFLVFLVAIKVYKFTKQKRYFFLAGSFLLLSGSFAARALTDLVIEGLIPARVEYLVTKAPVLQGFFPGAGNFLVYAGFVTHIMLALTSYLILVILTNKIQSKALMLLLFATILPQVLISGSYFLSFYYLTTVMLCFISFAFLRNCFRQKGVTSLLVSIAFILIAFAQIQFLLATLNTLFHVSAHITQFIGYVILLAALKVILK